MKDFFDTLVNARFYDSEDPILKNVIETYLPPIGSWLLRLLIAIVIWMICNRLIQWVMKLVERTMTHRGTEITVAKFLKSMIRCILYILLIVMLVDFLGVPTASLLAALSSAGLAIGLALQGSLSNFAGGVLILVLHPFRVGDYITESATGKEGTVQKIDLFYTTLLTADNQMVTIPNGTLANTSITNVTNEPDRRLDITVGISYDADLTKTKQVLSDMLAAYEPIKRNKECTVVVSALQSSCVEITCRCWVRSEDYWTARFTLTERVKLTLDENNITIPYNQLDVHVVDK